MQHKSLDLLLLLLYVAAAEFVQLTEALEVLLDASARVCIAHTDSLHYVN